MTAQRAIREEALAQLVGMAHFTRAKQRALTYAARYERDVYVFRTTSGFTCDLTKPALPVEHWQATPAGAFTHVGGPVS